MYATRCHCCPGLKCFPVLEPSREQKILFILQLFWVMWNIVWPSHNNNQGHFLQAAGIQKVKFLNEPSGMKKTAAATCQSWCACVGGCEPAVFVCVCVSVLMSCRLESLSLWLLVNLSQDTIVAANTGFWSPVPGRNANWNLISHPSTNYRSSAPTHELSKNWGERVGPLLGLIV